MTTVLIYRADIRVFAIRPTIFVRVELVTAQKATYSRSLVAIRGYRPPRQIGLQLLRGLEDEVIPVFRVF